MINPRYHDIKYLQLQEHVLKKGHTKTDRTGTGTTSVFGYDMRFDITNNIIPVLTTKKMHWPSLIHEIIWYMSGTGNIKYLLDNGVRIWREWANENGDLGPVYGVQMRNWAKHNSDGSVTHIDQIADVINTLKTNPDSRRLIVSSWNVADLDEMALPPCHAFFQFYTRDMNMDERVDWLAENGGSQYMMAHPIWEDPEKMDAAGVPRKFLSCKLTQR